MNNSKPITLNRRAALIGVVASTTALAVPAVASEPHVQDMDDRLYEAARRFRDECKAIDPSITRFWFGKDETIQGRPAALFNVIMERDTPAMGRFRV